MRGSKNWRDAVRRDGGGVSSAGRVARESIPVGLAAALYLVPMRSGDVKRPYCTTYRIRFYSHRELPS